MHLDRVTITGADDSTSIPALLDLSKRFPFVEWGILMSATSAGRPRFPSRSWIDEFLIACASDDAGVAIADPAAPARWPRLSAHVCGRWVRQLVEEGVRLPGEVRAMLRLGRFERVQLNYHGEPHKASSAFFEILKNALPGGWIFQVDGVNDGLFSTARGRVGGIVHPLFDLSGGAGVLPKRWPEHPGGDAYAGYAGGLSPANLSAQLDAIAHVAAGEVRTWIDVETHVRTPDDSALDLAKVEEFLTIARPWVVA